ncbi:hypothetical protein LMG26689_00303 [Achromobacter animicus]|uniref:hypothetical protein n=1 Tax=Achromobacter animicus TaxID=1389935 RepID=UPI0014654E6E|nr:hypothetical protein [Achromobacter animicus]CAB3817920.1 hypothetical protein LMG26689_00303 [Achromobacter animicus]
MSDHSQAELENGASQQGNLVQFLLWIAARPRTYAETMEAWRTHCPRLSAWEDATANGLIDMTQEQSTVKGEAVLVLTEKGRALLASHAPIQGAQAGPDGS